ncbi:hypothetical protein IHE56_00645 [Streptomyces sp. ID01-12c]|nr:hypothetical protein [Streptomyces caniscabiei]
MPFPDGVQTVTLTAGTNGYRTLDGDPYQGTIKLTPSVSRVTSATHGVIALGPVNATIGASGQFTEDLEVLAIDADDFSPAGWTYRVDETFTNAPGRAYNISLPAAAPTVALPSLAPVESSSGTVSSPAVLSVNGDTGVVTLDATDVGAVSTARQVIAGTGLTGGGALTADRTLTVSFGATGTTVCAGNDARLSDARTPLAHAASHGSAGSDPITIAQSQVTGLTVALDAKATTTYVDSTFATQATVTTINGFVTDCLTRVAAIENGTAFLAGLNVDGDAQVANGNLTVTDFVKGYRFRTDGDALDLEATGTDLVISNWSGSGFNGTQRSYARLSADALNTQWAGKFESVGALYGGAVHTLDPTTGIAGLGGKNSLTPIRLAGFKNSAGAPAAGTWVAGDVVLDSAGAWHLCTTGGEPGVWT